MLSYRSTREFLRTREKCGARAEGAYITQQCSRNKSFISFIKCIVNYARSYRWRRLRTLYLNNALVWRKARALWKYNELVLTNHGARIFWTFHNILDYSHWYLSSEYARYKRSRKIFYVYVFHRGNKMAWFYFETNTSLVLHLYLRISLKSLRCWSER